MEKGRVKGEEGAKKGDDIYIGSVEYSRVGKINRVYIPKPLAEFLGIAHGDKLLFQGIKAHDGRKLMFAEKAKFKLPPDIKRELT